jgi:Immunity protein family (Imm11)
MHYVMKMDTRLAAKFIYFRKEPAGFKGALWRTGEKVTSPPAPMTVIAEDEKPTKLSDMLLLNADLHVYSPKMRATLDAAGVTNIEYFPITVIDQARGKTWDDYRVANILGNIACLDIDKSVVKPFADGVGYRVVEEFHLIEERIRPLPGMKTPPVLFRLAEFPFYVIAHESLKAACESAGLTGVRFIRTKDVA